MYLTVEASAHAEIISDLGNGLTDLLQLMPLLPNGPARMVARKAMTKIGYSLGRLENMPIIDPPSLN